MPDVCAVFRCPTCENSGLLEEAAGVRCPNCGTRYETVSGIYDFLGVPDPAIARELAGLAAEEGVEAADDLSNVKLLHVDHIETTGELLERSRDGRVRYYQQTAAAYLEALGRAQLDGGMRVLEIGAERTYWFLRVIRDFCDEAYALNIFYFISEENAELEWPVRVLGDMNELPFSDGYFDLVVLSATLHHTASPEKALREVARVLRIGGRAIVVNEPVEGRLKNLGLRADVRRHDRHEDIHEDPVTWPTWRQAIAASGLRADHFVPIWFTQKVASASSAPENVRFGELARRLQPALRRPAVQDLARVVGRSPGQAILGLPFNAVLWKDARTP